MGDTLPENSGDDSVTMLPALLGEKMKPRAAMFHHSSGGFALRRDKWKIIFGRGQNRDAG
jgi:hypothetical protein